MSLISGRSDIRAKLREVAELSYDEIGEDLGIPQTTVRGKLARARAKIHAQMEGWR